MKIIKKGLNYSELIEFIKEDKKKDVNCIIIANKDIVRKLFRLYGYSIEPNDCIGIQCMAGKLIRPCSYIREKEHIKIFDTTKIIEILHVTEDGVFIINKNYDWKNSN